MNSIVYTRVSTDIQEREGTSLDSQREACLAKAKELGYEASHILEETCSGLTLDRPKLSQLREWVRDKEVNTVIAYTLDRVSRNPVHLVLLQDEFERAGVELILVTETLDTTNLGKMITYIKGYASQLEAEKIRERTTRGIMERVKSGKLPSGRRGRLYGYNYIAGKGVGEGVRYPNESEAHWVRQIYEWCEGGSTLNGITYNLRALGVLPPSGKGFWHRNSVYRILTNPAYYGKTFCYTQRQEKVNNKIKVIARPESEWVEIPKATPPIISESLFQRIKVKLEKNKKLSVRNGKSQYLIRGHTYCSRCGRKYFGYIKWHSKPEGIGNRRYYHCIGKRKIQTPNRCDNRSYRADLLEASVWQEVEAILSQPETVLLGLEIKREEAGKNQLLENELNTLKKQIVNRDKQKDRIHQAFYITGDKAKFQKDIAALQNEVKVLTERQVELENLISANEAFNANVEGVKQACEILRGNLKTLNFEEKRQVLEALQVRVVIDGSQSVIHGAIPIGETESIPSWSV